MKLGLDYFMHKAKHPGTTESAQVDSHAAETVPTEGHRHCTVNRQNIHAARHDR